jgi:hypothetical protein
MNSLLGVLVFDKAPSEAVHHALVQLVPFEAPFPGILWAPTDNRKLFELWVGDVMVKRLDIRAKSQSLILRAFQEEGWPARIDNPIPPEGDDDKHRLREVVRCRAASLQLP